MTYTLKDPTNRSHPIVGGIGERWVERQGLIKRKRETERERERERDALTCTRIQRERGDDRELETERQKQRQKDKGNSKKYLAAERTPPSRILTSEEINSKQKQILFSYTQDALFGHLCVSPFSLL